jgi:predicted nucleic acid-binding protein
VARFTVVYDACVLYPAPLRDALLRLAVTDLFKAHWTEQIHQEWIDAVVRQGKHPRESLERVRTLMDEHVRDALVTGYEPLIAMLELPDPDDRHVLAAAIRCNADAIVTFNLKDFPPDALAPYGIDVLHPDDFIYYQIDMAPAVCCDALRRQRLALKNPPFSTDDFLASLQKQQLPQTTAKLREFEKFL